MLRGFRPITVDISEDVIYLFYMSVIKAKNKSAHKIRDKHGFLFNGGN